MPGSRLEPPVMVKVLGIGLHGMATGKILVNGRRGVEIS
jgi:hypothetical protein